jgi:uncharacterized protein (TIGR00369 family)
MGDFLASMPLARLLGIRLLTAGKEEVEAELEWRPELCTTGAILHGGTLMAYADTVGAVCAMLNLPEGAGTATIESKTNFFRPVADGVVRAVAQPLHVGRRFIVVQTDLRDGAGKRVAQVTQTQAVLMPG